MDSNTLVQLIIAVISLISVILIYITILTNRDINKRILFCNITKEERELKIKLLEYKEKITNKEEETIRLDYETLLFNYYEYLAIAIYKDFINEDETKLYFKNLLKGVKEYFDFSLLFEKNLAKKEEYPGIQWLFKRWSL